MIILIKKNGMHLFFFLTYKLRSTDTGQYTDKDTSTLINFLENDIIQFNHMCRCQALTRFRHRGMSIFDYMCRCRTPTRLRHRDMSSITCVGVIHIHVFNHMCPCTLTCIGYRTCLRAEVSLLQNLQLNLKKVKKQKQKPYHIVP